MVYVISRRRSSRVHWLAQEYLLSSITGFGRKRPERESERTRLFVAEVRSTNISYLWFPIRFHEQVYEGKPCNSHISHMFVSEGVPCIDHRAYFPVA
jgi:hypothetical protein